MITLNGEQGLINVENWEDITSNPRFRPDLNPADHKLDSIIGRYIRKEKVKCGLSDCHTPHGKGYIITTKEGLSTNIGKDCGKTYFGVDFENLSKKFDRDVREKENRERLYSFSFQLEEIEQTISDLRTKDYGADWVYKKTRQLVSAGSDFPTIIVRHVTTMLKTGASTLSIQREATPDEIERLEAAQNRVVPKPHYVDEPIAEIAGIQALYRENDLRKLLVIDLEENLKTFKAKDIDLLTYEELRHWAKWVSGIEATLDKVAAAISDGNALLTRSNLEPFKRTLTEDGDKRLFRSYLNGLP